MNIITKMGSRIGRLGVIGDILDGVSGIFDLLATIPLDGSIAVLIKSPPENVGHPFFG